MGKTSHLHEAFLRLWELFSDDPWKDSFAFTEYKFTFDREWRLDNACPSRLVAVEIDGGTFTRGRHTRGKGYAEDCRKFNTATTMGWAVLHYTTDMLSENPIEVVREVQTLLENRPIASSKNQFIGIVRNLKPKSSAEIESATIRRISARTYEADISGNVLSFTQRKSEALRDLQRRVVDALDRKAA